jgi:hypothetical protein
VGFFSKLFGGSKSEPEAELEPDRPKAVVVLRRGMNVPAADYVAKVIAAAYPQGLPDSVKTFGLSQPSWYKTEEVADAIAMSVVQTFAQKLGLTEGTHVRRPVEGPDGCACMLVELID